MRDQVTGQPDDATSHGGSDDDGPAADDQARGVTPGASPHPGEQSPTGTHSRAQDQAAPWQSPGRPGSPGNTYETAPSGGSGTPFNPWGQPANRPEGVGTPSSLSESGYAGYPNQQGAPPSYGGPYGGSYGGGSYGGGSYGGGSYSNPYGSAPQYQAPQYQAPPKPGVIPLRPLGLGEILDGAFQACRKNPLATFGIAVLLQAVVALVTVLLIGNVLSSVEVFESQNPTPDSIIGAFASLGVFAAVAGVVSAVALLVLQGILVIPIARAVINQKTSFGQAWRLARARLLPLLGFGLLFFAAGLVGFVLLVGISTLAILGLDEYSALVIVPLVIGALVLLVWVPVKLVVAPAALMLEGTGPWTSMKRSWLLTRGNWWRTFGIVLLTSVIVSIIASVISTPLTFAVSLIIGFSSTASAAPDALDSLPILVATQAITALFAAIGYAFQSGVTSLLYVDLRIRREGFDVVLMREHEQSAGGQTDVLPGGTASFGHQPGGLP